MGKVRPGKRINARPRPMCRWCKSRPGAVCARCVAVDMAWLLLGRPGGAVRSKPFLLGYLVGAQDDRAIGDGLNPYKSGTSGTYWQLGHDAGVRHR